MIEILIRRKKYFIYKETEIMFNGNVYQFEYEKNKWIVIPKIKIKNLVLRYKHEKLMNGTKVWIYKIGLIEIIKQNLKVKDGKNESIQ